MARSRLSIAKSDIIAAFAEIQRKVFRRSDIERLLTEKRSFWRLAQSTTANCFIEFLLKNTELQKHRFGFPKRPTIRYTWGTVSNLAIVQSLDEMGYFSHFTALFLHGLTDQIPKTLYLNIEQRLGSGGGVLTQASINRAFASRCRVSANQAKFADYTVCLLNGGNTNSLGVVEMTLSDGTQVRVTNMERTLIDIVVRPIYSGGAQELVRAFCAAGGKVSVNKMLSYLRTLQYTYPYHQSIGYLLEKSNGYSPTEISLLEDIPREFDFYLTHQIAEKAYAEKWRLYVPKAL